MLQVKRIGHATLTTPDLERQLDYYTRVVGLSVVAKEKSRAVLATKPGHEVIVLEHGDRPAGVRLAFQVAPGSDLDELSARLSKAGIKCERRSDVTPGIARAVVFSDPKGTSVEIFADYGFAKEDDNDTGVMPRKLGHVAFHTPDVAGTVKFYCDVLGFRVSDWRSDFFAFLRCSRDHHTINLLQADNANIHHIAFELRDEAEINRACDFLARKNIKLFWGPIRHLIGHNIAIYHKNDRVLHRSGHHARRGPRLFRAAALAPGPAAAAEGLGRRHPDELLGARAPARHAGTEEISVTAPSRRCRGSPCPTARSPRRRIARPAPACPRPARASAR
jgi:catechol 2,3-dioxygenase-like lactoylglutathione lyase family enzyme